MRTLILLAVVATGFPALALAQAYPTRPLTFIVATAPGGTTDFTARLLADPLSRALKQNVLVDNRAGGSGNLGSQLAARAKPDGYTLLVQYSGYHATNPWLFKNIGWNPAKDFSGVGMAIVAPHLFVAHPSLPVKNLSDLARLARVQGDALSYASSGVGSIQHIGTELFLQTVKAKMLHVPYKGAGPAVIDLLSGQVAVFNTTPPSVVQHVRGGKLRALAYLSKERHPTMQEIPTSAQAGLPGYEVESWFAVFAPAGTPREIMDRLGAETARVVDSADFRRKAEEQGAFARSMDGKALDAYVLREIELWGKVIQSANITVEQ
ncbi:MAG: Bug family tripartite tricarboxylate transporter substrate binding protein [Burkholderiales bacterium]